MLEHEGSSLHHWPSRVTLIRLQALATGGYPLHPGLDWNGRASNESKTPVLSLASRICSVCSVRSLSASETTDSGIERSLQTLRKDDPGVWRLQSMGQSVETLPLNSTDSRQYLVLSAILSVGVPRMKSST